MSSDFIEITSYTSDEHLKCRLCEKDKREWTVLRDKYPPKKTLPVICAMCADEKLKSKSLTEVDSAATTAESAKGASPLPSIPSPRFRAKPVHGRTSSPIFTDKSPDTTLDQWFAHQASRINARIFIIAFMVALKQLGGSIVLDEADLASDWRYSLEAHETDLHQYIVKIRGIDD